MKCPYCESTETKVVDKRETTDDLNIRRRRECLGCEKRFTTYEKIELVDLAIVKKDGRRESFDKQKILRGLMKACEKRPVKREKIYAVVNKIEADLRHKEKTEISSKVIGGMIVDHLKDLDEVAYVRFASVYRRFRNTNQFLEVISKDTGSTND